ncbi:sulfotransferase 6B1 isoform X2 [Brachyhypopomus gauderio]|uniref:sulfotransferase 6B1 isoform X2 n=1 Tax=Brachyhypopomus gauderio TaxID=698409 RepID=UPI004041CABC
MPSRRMRRAVCKLIRVQTSTVCCARPNARTYSLTLQCYGRWVSHSLPLHNGNLLINNALHEKWGHSVLRSRAEMTSCAAQIEQLENRMERGLRMKDEEKLYKRNGILYSTIMSPPENLDAAKHMEAREEDVMMIAYPKCGFNWIVAVMRKIMSVSAGLTVPNRPPLIEFWSPDVHQTVAQSPSRRLIGSHLHYDNIPASFKTKKTKMLVVFRNPKDTAVSYYHFMNKNPVLPKAESWDTFFSDYINGEVPWGSYFDHALAWEKHIDEPNVKVVTYEELKENLPEGIRKVADFFSFPLTDEQVKAIAEETTFSAMVETSKKSYGTYSQVFFRKGEVGDWRNHFSEAQSKQMDEEFQKKLAGTKLGAKLKYDQYCM